jgi:hypothetical protein
MTVNRELERIWKEAFVVKSDIIQVSAWRDWENSRNPPSG